MKVLTRQKQPRVSTIQDENGKCLTEVSDIAERWNEYCKELYNHQSTGDPEMPEVPNSANDDDLLSELLVKAIKIYREIEIDEAIESLSEDGLIRMVVDENGNLGYEINFKD